MVSESAMPAVKDEPTVAAELQMDQYLNLVVSRRSFSTYDEPKLGMRILIDNATGTRYTISHDTLNAANYSAHL